MLRANWFRLFLIGILIVLVLLSIRLHVADGQSTTSELSGNASTGLRLAKMWCSECHAVERDSALVGRRAPDFADVAKRTSTTALSLNVFLRSSHETMPNVILTRGDADDIVAYILSLGRK